MHFGVSLSTLAIILNIIFIGILIFAERKDTASTWAWLFILALFPIGGFVIYLLVGRNLNKKLTYKKIVSDELKKKYLKNRKKHYTHDVATVKHSDLIMMNYLSNEAIYTQKNDVHLFTVGEDKFRSLLKDIKEAKEFIHLEYYIVKNDELGATLIHELKEKAKEGVEVKLLIDGVGSNTFDTKKQMRELKSAGIACASFFPSIIPFKLNFRNHRKIAVIDGQIGYVGGMNIGDEYIGRDPKIGNYRDTHLRLVGECVYLLEERFLLDWTFVKNEEMTDVHKYFPKKDAVDRKSLSGHSVGVQIVTSGPDHEEQFIRNGYLKIINDAKDYVYIQSPYLVLDQVMMEALKLSALSGVDVRIMIPKKPDHKIMSWAANAQIGELLNFGVKAYHYTNGFIHSKTIMADNSVCSVGTANMDMRSFRLNFEINAFIYNEAFTSQMTDVFMKDMDDCYEITKEAFKDRSLFDRMMESLVRLVAPVL